MVLEFPWQVMLILCLLWLATAAVAGQALESPDGRCEEGWQCRRERHCPPYLDQKDWLKRLETDLEREGDIKIEAEYQRLKSILKQLVCNQAEGGVCCKESVEIANGNVVQRVEDMPYIVRLLVKRDYASYGICGASLVASQFLLSAKHCFTTFDWCIDETDCVASFRDLKPGRSNHEEGEFFIAITDVYEREGISDLAVVKLKHKVEEHNDYKLGIPLQPIRLATENPKPGDEVITGGWGLTGYNEDLSEELRSLKLRITTVILWLAVPDLLTMTSQV